MIGMWTHPYWIGRIEEEELVLTISTVFHELFESLFPEFLSLIFTVDKHLVRIRMPIVRDRDSIFETYGMYHTPNSGYGLVVVLYRSTNGRDLFGLTSTQLLPGALALAPLQSKGAKFETYNLATQTVS